MKPYTKMIAFVVTEADFEADRMKYFDYLHNQKNVIILKDNGTFSALLFNPMAALGERRTYLVSGKLEEETKRGESLNIPPRDYPSCGYFSGVDLTDEVFEKLRLDKLNKSQE